jgi:hypothetical protein
MMQEPTPAKAPVKRRRSRLFVAGAIIAGAIAVPGVAIGGVAAYEGMHSGFFGAEGSTESVVGQEFLYTDSTEIVTVVQQLTTEFSLPPGANWDRVLGMYPTAERMLEQRDGIGQMVSFHAVCSWYRYWLDGDAAARATARPVIDAIPDWPYWHFTYGDNVDPASSPSPEPVVYTDEWSILDQIALETRTGVDTTVRLWVTANC